MIEFNKVLLSARLTKDPELRYIPSGQAVCDLRVAADRTISYDKGSGDRQKETLFINVTAWGKTAEFCNQYMKKGSAIFVEGRLKQDTWKDKNDGTNRERISIVADRVQFGETKAEAQSRSGRGGGEGDFATPPDSGPSSAARESSGPGPGGGAPGATHDDLPF